MTLYLRIAAAIAATALLWWVISAYNERLRDQGRQEIQAKFDEYRATQAALTQDRETQNAIKDAAATARNEATLNEYETKLASIANDRDSLARRLRNSQGACSAAGAQNNHRPEAIATSQEPSSAESVDKLYDDYDKACQADAAQLDALIKQLVPQL